MPATWPQAMRLVDVGPHCYAVVNDRNRLCDSNSGLVNAGGGLVIDTQCDLAHARRMIELFGTVWQTLPERVAITHEDVDHVWGNQLFPGAQIIAQQKIHERLPHAADPRHLQRLQHAAKHWLSRIVLRLSSPGLLKLADQMAEDYDFDNIEFVPPNVSFDQRFELNLNGLEVHLIHVGPGHQWGDTLVHVPAERVLFTGDVVFRQCTPIGWAGSFEGWQRSLMLVAELDPAVIVPGHGPICGLEGPRELSAYLVYVRGEARSAFDEGLSAIDAAKRIDFGPYDRWHAPGRLYLNVERAYREFRGEPFDTPWNVAGALARVHEVAEAHGMETTF